MAAPHTPRPRGGLSEEAVEALRRFTSDFTEDCSLAGGQIRIVRANLSEHAVVSIVRQDSGAIWLIMDANEQDTRRHLQELLTHWPEGVDEEVADAIAQEVGLSIVPDPENNDEAGD